MIPLFTVLLPIAHFCGKVAVIVIAGLILDYCENHFGRN